MTRVRDLTPDDARALTELYEECEWWTDRDVGDVRKALAETEVAVGLSLLCRHGRRCSHCTRLAERIDHRTLSTHSSL